MARSLAFVGAAVLTWASLTTGAAVGTTFGADQRGERPDHSTAAARQALERAQELFAGSAPGPHGDRLAGDPGHGREATLVLRDLAIARQDLAGADRRAADALLARPTDGAASDVDGYTTDRVKRACRRAFCVHWVERTSDAVPLADRNDNGRPDHVDRTLAALTKVSRTYREAGYRAPEGDGNRGGDRRTDIYLVEVADQGIYGYCTSDEPAPVGSTTWAYCVLDNDYARSQFPTHTPTQNMRVTAAHEYFHAVQYAYDFGEDRWFLESTATWAEDEVFDRVDDSVIYLRGSSPLTQPQVSLDAFDDAGHQYGTWIFFRYLTERLRTSRAGMPILVRDMWRRAAPRPGARDDYAIQAVRRVLARRDAGWTRTFTRFAESARRSRQVYDEGRALRYPVAPLSEGITLTQSRRATPWTDLRLNHLASRIVRFTPSRTMTHRRWRITLRVDMAAREQGSAAIATVRHRGRRPSTHLVRLDAQGDGAVRLPFSRRRVRAVELTLVNASTRFRSCGTGGLYSCGGWSQDEFLLQRVRGVAVR
jgi:hypothetical protein